MIGTPTRPDHLWQVDLLRITPMVGVVVVHVLIFTAPAASVGAGAALMALHLNRELFFFITAFVLFHSTGAATRPIAIGRFWRRRYPLVALPYLAWTLIYWVVTTGAAVTAPAGLRQLGLDLGQGWFHLYFLLVTMQFYALFPLCAWLLRRTRGHHGALLLASLTVQLAMTGLMQYDPRPPAPLAWWFGGAQWEVTSYQLYFLAGALAADHLPACLGWLRRHVRTAAVGSLTAVVAGEAIFILNLRLGESVPTAASVFQPALLPIIAGTLVGLWLLAERWLLNHPLDGRLWAAIRWASTASFGVYLAHMLPLLLLTRPPFLDWLPTDRLPWPEAFAARLGLVLLASAALVSLLRRTPLSQVLTGRAQLRRVMEAPVAR